MKLDEVILHVGERELATGVTYTSFTRVTQTFGWVQIRLLNLHFEGFLTIEGSHFIKSEL